MSKSIHIKIIILLTLLLHILIAVNANAQERLIGSHDPVAIREGDYYYVFATGNGISVMRSTDMKNWTRLAPVFKAPPQWATETIQAFEGHIWAPDIIRHNGQYYLYYSISSFGKRTSAIGVATAKTLDPESPDFGWTDHGMVVRSYEGCNWNAIDPNIIIDEKGIPWMTFGSWWDAIQLVRLQDNLLHLHQPEEWHALSSRSRDENGRYIGNIGAVEAPFLFQKDSYYYLFVSFDNCCAGVNSTYKVAVGRSKDIRGPYLDREGKDMLQGGGTIVVQGNERFPGVGHQAVYRFESKDYLFFHAYDRDDNGRSKLLVREIEWDEAGWPSVRLKDQ